MRGSRRQCGLVAKPAVPIVTRCLLRARESNVLRVRHRRAETLSLTSRIHEMPPSLGVAQEVSLPDVNYELTTSRPTYQPSYSQRLPSSLLISSFRLDLHMDGLAGEIADVLKDFACGVGSARLRDQFRLPFPLSAILVRPAIPQVSTKSFRCPFVWVTCRCLWTAHFEGMEPFRGVADFRRSFTFGKLGDLADSLAQACPWPLNLAGFRSRNYPP